MPNGSSVGGQTLITGETVLVTPEGEVVGSTTPEIFGGASGGGRRRREQPSPPPQPLQIDPSIPKPIPASQPIVVSEGFQTLITGQEAIVTPSGRVRAIGAEPTGDEIRFVRLSPSDQERAEQILESRRQATLFATQQELASMPNQTLMPSREPSGFERFLSGIPTLGGFRQQQIDRDIQSQVAEFESFTPTQAREAALLGRPGVVGQSTPTGELITFTPQVSQQPAGGFFESPSRSQELSREIIAVEGQSGFVRRGAGSIFLGGLRFGSENIELGRTVLAETAGQGRFIQPTGFTRAIRAQPSDPLQSITSVAPLIVGGAGLARGFAATARAEGIGAALGEAVSAISPLRARPQTRIISAQDLGSTGIARGIGIREGRTTRFAEVRPGELGLGEATAGEIVEISPGVTGFRGTTVSKQLLVQVRPSGFRITRLSTEFPIRGTVEEIGSFRGLTAQRVATRTPFGRTESFEIISPVGRSESGTLFAGVQSTPGRRAEPFFFFGTEGARPAGVQTLTRPGRISGLSTRPSGISISERPLSVFPGFSTIGGQPLSIRPTRRALSIFPSTGISSGTTSLPLSLGKVTPSVFQGTGLTPVQAQVPSFAQIQIPNVTTLTTLETPSTGLGLDFFRPAPFRGGGFGFPGILPGFGLIEGGGRRPKGKRKLRRQPSFAALFFDIRESRKRPFEETGLVLRPILR